MTAEVALGAAVLVDQAGDAGPREHGYRCRALWRVDKRGCFEQMSERPPGFYHLHLVSDSTGETLTTIAKAASSHYGQMRPIEHVHPLVRTKRSLDRVIQEIRAAPGIVLFTIVNDDLSQRLEAECRALNIPFQAVLNPLMELFRGYLGEPTAARVGGQHVLDAAYFRRIEALNFAMLHDDGQLPENLDEADIIVLGISRTSKTPTSIYLANRGYRTTNLPLVPEIAIPERLTQPTTAFVIALIASVDRIAQVRRNRVLSYDSRATDTYVDKDRIADEIAYTRGLCRRHQWPIIDVTRRSIEETAAAILQLKAQREPARAGEDAASSGVGEVPVTGEVLNATGRT